ncbi:MAG: hypothetical protein WCJ30_22965, partial [Deltaproteobacteria bacterium]
MTVRSRGRRPLHGFSALLAGGATALAVGLASPAVEAQNLPPLQPGNGGGFDFRLFRPAIDSKGQFSVNGTDILGAWDVAFGLVVDYGRSLGRIGMDPNTMRPTRSLVENQFNGTFVANVGLFNWLVFGIQLPFHLSDGPGGANGLDTAQYNANRNGLSFQGIGDLALNLKLRLLRAEVHHFGVAILFQAGFALNNDANGSVGARNFVGEPGPASLWPSIALEWRPVRIFRVDLNFGYRHFFGTGSTLTPAGATTGVTYSPPLTAGLGMSVRVIPAMELVAETYMNMYTSALGNPNAMPWEVVGGLKVFVQ